MRPTPPRHLDKAWGLPFSGAASSTAVSGGPRPEISPPPLFLRGDTHILPQSC